MPRIIFALMTFTFLAPTAQAMDYRSHKQTKNLVRLSLWYEGPKAFNNSAFRPEAVKELSQQARQATENTKAMPEELEIALENLKV